MENQINKISNDEIDKLIINSKWPMNSLSILVPLNYFQKKVNLTWEDILFAIDNGFLSAESAVDFAMIEMEKKEKYSSIVLNIISLNSNDARNPDIIHECISESINVETKQEKEEIKDKIMYVVLNWVFENKQNYLDPLKVVEIIYDDFGFPKKIINFVRYMPMNGKNLGSLKLNEERLLINWEKFLDNQRMIYCSCQ